MSSPPRSRGLGGRLRIARIAGIDVRLHWTWAAAVATALLFFVSLLLHELDFLDGSRETGLAGLPSSPTQRSSASAT